MCAQLCLTLCDYMNCSLVRPLYPWDFPGKNSGVGLLLYPGPSPDPGSMSPALAHGVEAGVGFLYTQKILQIGQDYYIVDRIIL